jgi:uncharacterized protein (TIGR03086 family)
MSALITAIPDGALDRPTPCTDYSLGDLVEHVGGLAQAFTQAAEKSVSPGSSSAPAPDGARLEAGWRARIAADLERLGSAWQQPDAWVGMTEAGGVQMPGDLTGLVALNELVLHGWDVARATGQDYRPTEPELRACGGLLAPISGPGTENQRPSIYGPELPMPADAPSLDRLLGMAGRDPHWHPGGRPMTVERTGTVDRRFSDPNAAATPWAATSAALADAELYWLTTVRGDGRPHVAPLTAIWVDDEFLFSTGDDEQKAHNLVANPRVAITTGNNRWTAGLDVVIEGVAGAVTETVVLQRFADLMRTKYHGDWDYQVRGEFVSPGGDALARLYRVSPAKVLAFAKDPHGQTRYGFDGG